jgi:glycosyltransferase involved in cell wall biosynthesis
LWYDPGGRFGLPPFYSTTYWEAPPLLRVIQVAHYYGPLGGIERVVHQFCHGLAGTHEVEAVVCNTHLRTLQSTEEGIPVTRVGRVAHFQRMSVCPALALWLRKKRPDLVHVHMTNPMAELSYLLSGLKCKVIATYHMDVTRQRYLNTLYTPFQQRFLRRCLLVTASSENFARTSPVLSQWLDKVRVLPFGLAADALRESDHSRALTSQLFSEIGGPVVLFVGRLIHYKGLEVLVRAMRNVPATCLIAGEGYLAPSLRTQIASLGLSDRVRLVGRIPDEELVAYYDRADVFVLPSVNRTEAYGLTQIEAMSRGTPVVCCEVGTGTSFVNKDGVSGLVVPPNDDRALATALTRILSDSSLRSKFSRGAKERSLALFTEERMVAELKKLYEEVFSSS